MRGTRTTWGASPWKDRVIDTDSTVYTKLRAAGAILVAKLSTGALAVERSVVRRPDAQPLEHTGGRCGIIGRPRVGHCCGACRVLDRLGHRRLDHAPAERNGLAGLRPTFGRVSRYGGMTLAWTQDTVGPLCRSVEDCALVFDAIYGPDGKDNTVLDVPFGWDATADVRKLRVGYLAPHSRPSTRDQTGASRRNNDEALKVIRAMGIEVVPFDLPVVEIAAIDFIRWAETAAFFDEATRSGTLRESRTVPSRARRPADIRAGRFIPAVEYIQANRYRMRVMEQMNAAMSELDLFLGAEGLLTNRLGYPILSMPNGFFEGSPTALHMTGKLFGEPELLLLAHAFQSRTDHHLKHPALT